MDKAAAGSATVSSSSSASASSGQRWVRLNVGGTLFTTTKTTLENSSEFFQRLLNSAFNSDKDESGVRTVFDWIVVLSGFLVGYEVDVYRRIADCLLIILYFTLRHI